MDDSSTSQKMTTGFCPKCGHLMQFKADYIGTQVHCVACKCLFTATDKAVPVPQPLPPSLAPWEYATAISIALHLFGALLALIAVACVFNLAFIGALKGGDPIHSGLLLIAIMIYWLIMEIRAFRRVYVIRCRSAGGHAE